MFQHVQLVGHDRVLLGSAVDDVTLAVTNVDQVAAGAALDRVPPGAAEHGVGARSCVDPVVAGAAVDSVRPWTPADPVGASRSDEVVASPCPEDVARHNRAERGRGPR